LTVYTFVDIISIGIRGQKLEFEWDEAKARNNLDKHKVSFLTAAAVFLNERFERIDDREDYGKSAGLRWAASKPKSSELSTPGAERA